MADVNEPTTPDPVDRAMPPEDDEYLAAYEERLAARRASAIAAARRKGGLAGAAMAGAMLAISEIVEGPKHADAQLTVVAVGDPHQLVQDGFGAAVGEVRVEAPALELRE